MASFEYPLSLLRYAWYATGQPRWAVITGIFSYALYKFLTRRFGVFKSIGVNGPRPWPVVGTMIPFMRMGLTSHQLEMKRLYGSIVGNFFGSQPTMLIYDLDILKTLLVKDFANFPNRSLGLSIPDYPLNKMLTMLEDDQWKHVRNILTPTFSSGKLRKMQQQMEKCAETLLANLHEKEVANETLEFRDYCGAYTMDVIASTAFGLEIDSHNDPNNEFVRMSNKVLDFSLGSLKTVFLFFFPFLMKPLGKFGFRLFPKEATEFFVQAVDQALEGRMQDTSIGKANADFLQLMLNAEAEQGEVNDDDSTTSGGVTNEGSSFVSKQNRRGLTHEEVLAQSILFILAGYDTTASTLSFFGYLLAVNSDCQEKLIAEIDSVMKDQDHVTFDVINKMPYLDMCVSETLRLYPPGPRADRVTCEQTTINGVFIPKGMVVGIPIYALQNDPEYWPEPERFDPDRFLPEAKEARNPFCYMPFGMGPRHCIGMRLALMEIKLAMVHILRKFKIVVCAETQIPLKLEKVRMRGIQGIKLRVKSRDVQ
jgi:cytochrome P450